MLVGDGNIHLSIMLLGIKCENVARNSTKIIHIKLST